MKKSKKAKKTKNIKNIIKIISPLIIAILSCLGVTLAVNLNDNGKLSLFIEYNPEILPAKIINDEGEVLEDNTLPTVEEIDGGGLFKDTINLNGAESAVYYELGSIEEVNTETPEAFKESVIGRCIIANNFYGAQCVSLARAFWWDYAGFDVSTCGTGLAKGMMNCAEQNAGDRFKIIWTTEEIQDGTWIVLDGSRTGHVCMALGKPYNGYVACLGENQGGADCGSNIGGAAANVINLSLKNFIGGYTPVDYIVPEPEPEPTPLVPDTGIIK